MMVSKKPVVEPFVMGGAAEGITPPDDLRDFIERLKMVQRYIQDDYPAGEIIDDTFSHELRCLGMARGLRNKHPEFRDFDFGLLERIIWLHDLGELHLEHDVTAVEQARSQQVVNEKTESEYGVVSKLLGSKDLELIKEMERAGQALKKGRGWEGILPEAAIAYIIDKVDSNMCFHYWVSKSSQVFPRDSLIFTFTQYQRFLVNLGDCPFESVLVVGGELLREQLKFINDSWSVVPETQKPKVIREQLGHLVL